MLHSLSLCIADLVAANSEAMSCNLMQSGYLLVADLDIWCLHALVVFLQAKKLAQAATTKLPSTNCDEVVAE